MHITPFGLPDYAGGSLEADLRLEKGADFVIELRSSTEPRIGPSIRFEADGRLGLFAFLDGNDAVLADPKEGVGQDKVARIGKVVRNIGFGVPSISAVFTVNGGPGDEVESIHRAVVNSEDGALERMVYFRGMVRRMAELNPLARRNLSEGRTVGASKGTEIVVKGVVLLDHKNDMLDLLQADELKDVGQAEVLEGPL